MGILKLKTVSGILLVISLSESFPRKKLFDAGNSHPSGSRLASVLSDYWSQRGFHDAGSDYLLASESHANARYIPGVADRVFNFPRENKIRIPRGRLAPPAPVGTSKSQNVVNKLTLALRNRQQQRKRLVTPRKHNSYPSPLVNQAAQRKQDMEIMESVTLIDGGTPQSDGTIKVRPRVVQQSERKYQQGPVITEFSPLNYPLEDADLTLPYRQQQPSAAVKYNTLPFGAYTPGLQGKLPHDQSRLSKVMSMSLHQFQQQQAVQNQLFQLPQPTSTSPISVFVVSPPPTPNHLLAPLTHSAPLPLPISSPTPYKVSTTLATSYPSGSSSKDQKSQVFEAQFHHPFATEAPLSPIRSLAQLTATLLSGASSVAAATSAAASTFAKSVGTLTSSTPLPPTSSSGVPSFFMPPVPAPVPFQSYNTNAISPSTQEFELGSNLPGELHQEASILSASQLRPPTTPSPLMSSTTLRVGVVSDEDVLVQNQLVNQQESLVNKIKQLFETGRKILYFPKGVVDTVDVFLKQMERNPTVAYLGDKFFDKVFGDTSGT